MQMNKKEERLTRMPDDEVKGELKDKGLAIYGTKAERLDRLKKYHGIIAGAAFALDEAEAATSGGSPHMRVQNPAFGDGDESSSSDDDSE